MLKNSANVLHNFPMIAQVMQADLKQMKEFSVEQLDKKLQIVLD